MSEWGRRLLVTLGIVSAAHALQHVTLPFMAAAAFTTETVAGGWLIVARESTGFGVAALGIVPLGAGLGLTSIVFALVPRLRHSLAQADGERRALRVAFVASVALALVQASAIVLFLQKLQAEVGIEGLSPWLSGATLVAFAALYAALPFALQRWGLGRGLSAAVLLYCLLGLAASLHAMAFDWFVAPPGRAKPIDLALMALVIVATVGATRRWAGDANVLASDPRFDRIGLSLSMAMVGFVVLKVFVAPWLAPWAAFGPFGQSLAELCIAVGGGLWLAGLPAMTPEEPPIAKNQLLALGSFVLLLTLAIALFADGYAQPWSEMVVATILVFATWRSARLAENGDRAADAVPL